MAIPDYQKLMYPVLKFLGDKKEHSGIEITNVIADQFKLTEEERLIRYPNNSKKIFPDRVAWARTYLKKAELIDYPERSLSKITDLGVKVLKSKPKTIDNKFLMQFEPFRKFRNMNNNCSKTSCKYLEKEDVQLVNTQTPYDMIYSGINTWNANLENDLIEKLLAKHESGFFEEIVAKLLVNMGYGSSYDDIIQLKGGPGDGGIDGIIKQDVLGLDKVYIQAKQWDDNKPVPSSKMREFVGALGQKKAAKGVYITTSRFTEPAVQCAKEVKETIVLIDGQALAKLMIEYNIGVQLEDTILIKKIDEDFF